MAEHPVASPKEFVSHEHETTIPSPSALFSAALYTHFRASSPSLGVVQSFGTPRVCVPCCCLGSTLRLESIVRCSSCSERIFCWFGINYFHCQSRTSQPSASLPSCNFFASPLELEPFHLTSAAAVLPCLYTTRTMIKMFVTC